MQAIDSEGTVSAGGPILCVTNLDLGTQLGGRGALIELKHSAFQDLVGFLAVLLHNLQLAVVGHDLIGLVLDLVAGVRVVEDDVSLVRQLSGVAHFLALDLEGQRHLVTGLNLGKALVGQLNDELVSVLSRIVDLVVTGTQSGLSSLDLGDLLEVQTLVQLILEAEGGQALTRTPGRSIRVDGVGVRVLDVLICILDSLLGLGFRVLRVRDDVVVPGIRCLVNHRHRHDERSTGNDAGRSVSFLYQVDTQRQISESCLAISAGGFFLGFRSLLVVLDVSSRLRERRPIILLQVVIELGDLVGHARQSLTRNVCHFLTGSRSTRLSTLLLEEGDRALLVEIDVCLVHGALLSSRLCIDSTVLRQGPRSGDTHREANDGSESNRTSGTRDLVHGNWSFTRVLK